VSIAFSPNGAWLAVGNTVREGTLCNTYPYGYLYPSNWVDIWDVKAGTHLASYPDRKIEGSGTDVRIAFSPDGTHLAVLSKSLTEARTQLRIWDTKKWELMQMIDTEDHLHLFSFAFGPNGQLALCGNGHGKANIEIWAQ
jgi:WD40 repeat protein